MVHKPERPAANYRNELHFIPEKKRPGSLSGEMRTVSFRNGARMKGNRAVRAVRGAAI